MTIAPDEPDIAELDFEPEPEGGPALTMFTVEGTVATFADTHPEDWNSSYLFPDASSIRECVDALQEAVAAICGIPGAIIGTIASGITSLPDLYAQAADETAYESTGHPLRSIGLLGAHHMPISGMSEHYNQIDPRPEGMSLHDWLINCTPNRSELLGDVTCTARTWITGDDTDG